MDWKWTSTDTRSGLRIVSTGGGPPLLMLHGVTRRWQTFLPLLGALATRRSLHLLDARGHGESTRGWESYWVEDYIADGIEIARTWIEPLAVYGHSLGAMTALAVAAACPDRISAVILEDPPFDTMGEGISRTRLQSYFDGLWRLMQERPSEEQLRRRLPDLCYEDPTTGESWRLGQIRDGAGIRFAAWCLRDMEAKVVEPIAAGSWLGRWNWRDDLSRVRCPVLLLQADVAAGGMLTDADAADCRERVADLSLVRWPNTGHVIHELRSADLAAKVLGFLETTS